MFLRNVFVLFCLLVSSQLFSQQDTTKTRVKGIVINVHTQEGIPNAVVSVNNQSVVTDTLGKFQLSIEGELQDYFCSHIGFKENINPRAIVELGNHTCKITFMMEPYPLELEKVDITGQRASNSMPVTYDGIKGSQLLQINFGEDMPFLLESLPSTVATSDAGNAVGYSGLRIRGSDATRVNITINGVPYNDAESQQTYWVDLPDFASSVDDIQVQRGIGTTNNGLSSFGASVNINTNKLSQKPGASVQSSIGSFDTRKLSLAYNSGAINNHWFIEGRASTIHSDGYIDRAFSDLHAWFVTGAYMQKKYVSIINAFSGSERTYQAWGGVPAEVLDTNRTYNPYTYENQTDNYTQTHYQWHQYFYPKNDVIWRLTLNYTKGAGYYEQLEDQQTFSDYGAVPVIINTDTIFTSDMITQKWLDNNFYGAFLQYTNEISSRLNITGGVTYYGYNGTHYGKVIWSEFASTIGYNYEWYRNDAQKSDAAIYAQAFYKGDVYALLADIQARYVGYQFVGYNVDGELVDQQVDLTSVNPKIGITRTINKSMQLYAFLGMSNKEPNRDDYTESTPESRPLPEQMINLEIGERYQNQYAVNVNYFMMYYINQLVLTGQINDVGAYTRTNIPRSYRTGLELTYNTPSYRRLVLQGNVTYSMNKVLNYTEYIDDWDSGEQVTEDYSSTDIAFSPSWITYNQISALVLQHKTARAVNHFVRLNYISKTVGKQYVDNTGSDERSLDAYWLNDVSAEWLASTKNKSQFSVTFTVQNIFNEAYESNAWTYRYRYGGADQQMMGYYPQAGINWLLGLRCSF